MQDQKGLTLVEVIIYVTIVSMILTVAVFFAWDVIGGQTKSYVITEVNQNSRFLINTVAKDIKQATVVNSLTATDLSMGLITGDTIIYSFDTDLNTLSRQINTDDPIVLHSEVVDVTGSWEDLSTDQSSTIGLDLNIEYSADSGHTDWESSLDTSVSFNLNLQ